MFVFKKNYLEVKSSFCFYLYFNNITFFLLTYWTLKLIGDNDLGLSCVCHGGAVRVPCEVSR